MAISSISPSLLGRLQSPISNDEAWGRLMELCGPLLYTRCRRANVPAQDVADVGQEVFLDVMKGIGEFRRDRAGDTFRGWLARITQRRIADYWRRRQRIPEGAAAGGSAARHQLNDVPDHSPPELGAGSIPAPAGNPDGEESAEADSEDATALRRRALELISARFEPRTWRACWLLVMDGRTAEDVAAELGLSVNAVRVAKSRVLGCLRDEFGDLLD